MTEWVMNHTHIEPFSPGTAVRGWGSAWWCGKDWVGGGGGARGDRSGIVCSIAGIKRNPRPVLRFEFGVVAVGRVWFRLDFGCRSPV